MDESDLTGTVPGAAREADVPKIAGLGERCCGCGACSAACPRTCISMEADPCGFVRPRVDAEACVGCGSCDGACPALAVDDRDGSDDGGDMPAAWWAQARDEGLVAASSSGGVFSLLARDALGRGGAVYGAALDEGCMSVRHIRISDEGGLVGLRRSKYVQSAVGRKVYRAIEDDVKAGRPVLFSGTACQVAGVRNYLAARGVPGESLICVDVVCHGAPSPKVWRLRVQGVAKKLGAPLTSVNFRDKRTGWESYSVTYRATNGREATAPWEKDWFMAAFLQNASLRGSCLSCPFKVDCPDGCRSDLTLGDYWGIREAHPEVEPVGGVSAVLVRSEAGAHAFERIAGKVRRGESSAELVVARNPSLLVPARPHPHREEFLAHAAAAGDVRALMRRWGFGLTLRDKVARVLWRRE